MFLSEFILDYKKTWKQFRASKRYLHLTSDFCVLKFHLTELEKSKYNRWLKNFTICISDKMYSNESSSINSIVFDLVLKNVNNEKRLYFLFNIWLWIPKFSII